MKTARDQHRRGVALLMTLAVLVLVVTVAAGIARLSTTAAMHERFDLLSSLVDDLLIAAEAPIRHWLAHESADVVLATDAFSPEVHVMRQRWSDDDLSFELQVTAWDQEGMAPIELIRRGSPLRLAVPQHALDIVDHIDISDGQMLGLDNLADDWSQNIWPVPRREHDILILESSGTSVDSADGVQMNLPAVGALAATHNPRNQVNVNTAPIPLIEQAMRMAGRGGVEQIIAARTAGVAATVPAAMASPGEAGDAPQLVAGSSCWSFRIDVRVASVQRSWWEVYELCGDGWTCVQRLAIPR
jgi:hypothetical protein